MKNMRIYQTMNQNQDIAPPTLSDPVLLSDERHKGKLSHLSVILWNMLKQNQACDIKIKTCDVNVNAHSCILIAASEYFKKCFDLISRMRGTEGISGVLLDLRPHLGSNLNHKDMMNILHYIYTGEMEVTPDNCIFLFKASKVLGLESLTELIIPHCLKICSLQLSDSESQNLPANEKQHLYFKNNYEKHEAVDTSKSESQTLQEKGVKNNPEEEHISLVTGNILPEHDVNKDTMGGETSNDIKTDSFEEKEPQMETESSHLMNLECDEEDVDASQRESHVNSENLYAHDAVDLKLNEMISIGDELISNHANQGKSNDDELITDQGAHFMYDQGNVNAEMNSNDEPILNENRVSSVDERVHIAEDTIKYERDSDDETTKDASSATISSNMLNKNNEMNREAFVTLQCAKLEIENKTIIPAYIDHQYSSILNTDMVNAFQDVLNVNIQKMNELKDEDGTNDHRDGIHEETQLYDQERYLDLYQEKCQYAVTHNPFNTPCLGKAKPWPVSLENITSQGENEIGIGHYETYAENKEAITGDSENDTGYNDTKIDLSEQVPDPRPEVYGTVEEVSNTIDNASVMIKRSCRVKCKRMKDKSAERKKIKCTPRRNPLFKITQSGIRCPNCKQRFKNELKLLTHFITCWTGEPVTDLIKINATPNLALDNFAYCCDNCQMPPFLNYRRFLRHCYFCYQTKHKGELIFESIRCYKCNKFVSEKLWMRHLQICPLPSFDKIPATRSPAGLSCHICTYKIKIEKVRRRPSESNRRLARHMYSKHGIVQSGFRLLKCAEEYRKEPDCTYATLEKKHLNEHIKNKHKQNNIIGPKFQCEECGHRYYTKTAMEDCLEVHSRSEPVPCRMPSCMKTFLTNRREKRHYNTTHNEVKAEKRRKLVSNVPNICPCQACGVCFKGRHSLVRHESKVHKIPLPKDFHRHYNTTHNEVKAEKRRKLVSNVPNICPCQACGVCFKGRHSLVRHESKVHKIPLPKDFHRYQCKRCSYWDITFANVRTHESQHEKLRTKLYSCEMCGKKFTSFFSKEVHYRTYHEGKGYKCEHCDKLLRRKGSLIRHTRIMHTHKNTKKYQCHLCEYCSNVKGNLHLHLRNKHKLKVATLGGNLSVRSEQPKDAVIVTNEGNVVPYVPELSEDLHGQS